MSVPLFDEKNKEIKVSYELCPSVECFLSDQLGEKEKKKTESDACITTNSVSKTWLFD